MSFREQLFIQMFASLSGDGWGKDEQVQYATELTVAGVKAYCATFGHDHAYMRCGRCDIDRDPPGTPGVRPLTPP